MAEQWQNSRGVGRRIYVQGKLVLDTPTHLGNGDTESLADIALLWDEVERQRPLLTGASLAGALRNYVREFEAGFGVAEQKDGALLAEQLFGYLQGYEATVESWLMVDDALGWLPDAAAVEIRDGVAIDPKTRTARNKKKFDVELLPAGTTFDLHFELWLPQGDAARLRAFVMALSGLEAGKIGLGMRKRRGYGRCHVDGWQVKDYDMTQPADVLGWFNHAFAPDDPAKPIAEWFPDIEVGESNGRALHLKATFNLLGSILIRAAGEEGDGPDMVHLRSYRPGNGRVPILSATSLAGALRGRALRIANTLGKNPAIIDDMFGQQIEIAVDKPTGSRLLVREATIDNGIADRVQSRVKIDRFTGGAYPQALFSQQPVWAKALAPTQVTIHLELRQYGDAAAEFEAQAGLLLLLLKDLWTGDLALGGESSVGRGRLQGETVTIEADGQTWTITRQGEDGQLQFAGDDPKLLEEKYLATFKTAYREETA